MVLALVLLGVVEAGIIERLLAVGVSKHAATLLVESWHDPLSGIIHLLTKIVFQLLPELIRPAVYVIDGS